MADSLDAEKLITWFEAEKRDLPWRNHPTPYAVWVSEVMLQQTRVSVVIPYYERWMERFPTIRDLASSELDEVIKLWEGLGYYSRARNLWQGAKTVCQQFGGELPEEADQLASIKGLGPYTVGAIRSFAFHQKAAAVDGNVLRVAARYFQITEDIAKSSTVKKIREMVEEALPEKKHWVVNEALIELGATICGKKPACGMCPLRHSCRSFRHGKTDDIPYKSTKSASIPLFRAVAVISCGHHYLVRRGAPGEIMQDLHEFPYFETPKEGLSVEDLYNRIHGELGIKGEWQKQMQAVTHTFTKYRVQLQPHLFTAAKAPEVEGYVWMSPKDLKKAAFSSGHRRIYQRLNP